MEIGHDVDFKGLLLYYRHMTDWKQVAGFPNYEVSDDGRVRNTRSDRLISLVNGNQGSVMVNLWRNNKHYFRQVHRLVAEAFIGIPDGMTVNHINGERTDNKIHNLEVVTQAQNNWHKVLVLGKGRGEGAGGVKLKEADVLQIRKLRADGVSAISLAEQYGMHREQIRNICTRKQWRHI